jgi:hypothetical protein
MHPARAGWRFDFDAAGVAAGQATHEPAERAMSGLGWL